MLCVAEEVDCERSKAMDVVSAVDFVNVVSVVCCD